MDEAVGSNAPANEPGGVVSSETRRWKALDVAEAEAFDRYMVPRILGPLAERLLNALGLVTGPRLSVQPL